MLQVLGAHRWFGRGTGRRRQSWAVDVTLMLATRGWRQVRLL